MNLRTRQAKAPIIEKSSSEDNFETDELHKNLKAKRVKKTKASVKTKKADSDFENELENEKKSAKSSSDSEASAFEFDDEPKSNKKKISKSSRSKISSSSSKKSKYFSSDHSDSHENKNNAKLQSNVKVESLDDDEDEVDDKPTKTKSKTLVKKKHVKIVVANKQASTNKDKNKLVLSKKITSEHEEKNKKPDLVSNIEDLLKQENKLNANILNQNENKKNASDEEDDDWEEVEMENTFELEQKIAESCKAPIQLTIDNKKRANKKEVDLAAKAERMFRAMQKKLGIMMIKTHLVLWLNHGFYLNKICTDEFVRSVAFSINEFTINNFKHKNFNKKVLNEFILTMNQTLKFTRNKQFLSTNLLVTSENLVECISNQTCSNYLQYILIILIALRNMNIKSRLCVCFDVIPLKQTIEQKPKVTSLSEKSESIIIKQNLAKKRKSSEVNKKAENGNSKSKCIKISEKLAVNSHAISSSEDEDQNNSFDRDFKQPAIKRLSTANLKKNNDEKMEICNKKNDDKNILSSSEATKIKSKSQESKITKIDKILSSDSDDENSKRNTDYRNYWLEVYLEKEKTWISVEPFYSKLDCISYLDERFDGDILYVCGYDNDNKAKDITKRYALNWCTSTRLSRISHLDDKKLWWERTLMYHQPLDPLLDIQEEQELKKNLLSKELPQSVSDFKDHPLYVLERHLLKFQAIYPKNVDPVDYLRNKEAVYSRDNLSTLHSRQTWLKYARMVKPFESAYKVVKGRLKASEYKAGMRDNPDLDLFGFWQTKPYEPPIAENGRIPRNEFGNVELFQPNMIPIGTVHLRNMPNLNRVCRKLKIDCAAAVVGFDAHGGFSHAVYDGWIVCQEHKQIVIEAFQQEQQVLIKKQIEKRQERIINNWAHLVKLVLIRERLNLKYNTKKSLINTVSSSAGMKENSDKKNLVECIDGNENVGAKLNQPSTSTKANEMVAKNLVDKSNEEIVYKKIPNNSNLNKNTKNKKNLNVNQKEAKDKKSVNKKRGKKTLPSSSETESEEDEDAQDHSDNSNDFKKSKQKKSVKVSKKPNEKKAIKPKLQKLNQVSDNENDEQCEKELEDINPFSNKESAKADIKCKNDDDFKLSESEDED